MEDLVLVLEEAKTAQLALKAAAATHEAEASMRVRKSTRQSVSLIIIFTGKYAVVASGMVSNGDLHINLLFTPAGSATER